MAAAVANEGHDIAVSARIKTFSNMRPAWGLHSSCTTYSH
jgi:hypothetical protein